MQFVKRIALLAGAVAIGLVLYWTWAVMEARAVTPLMLNAVQQRQDLQIQALPESWIDTLVAVEDPSFWGNDGIDFSTPGQGLTTLTQGLAKRLYFDRYSPGFEKAEVILFAKFALNAKAPKEDILRAFLTVAYFGEDELGSVIGFPDAARRWYNAELSTLTEDQFIGLVAMLISPNALNPKRNASALNERVQRIKRLRDGACTPAGLTDVFLEGCGGLNSDQHPA